MNDFKRISQNLVKSLSLQHEPVGVILYKEEDSLPPEVPFTQNEFKSYCHALVAAGQLLALSLWFSASAVAPQLEAEWSLSGSQVAGLTLAALRERAPSVPTLEEALDLVRDRIPFTLELKRAAELYLNEIGVMSTMADAKRKANGNGSTD